MGVRGAPLRAPPSAMDDSQLRAPTGVLAAVTSRLTYLRLVVLCHDAVRRLGSWRHRFHDAIRYRPCAYGCSHGMCWRLRKSCLASVGDVPDRPQQSSGSGPWMCVRELATRPARGVRPDVADAILRRTTRRPRRPQQRSLSPPSALWSTLAPRRLGTWWARVAAWRGSTVTRWRTRTRREKRRILATRTTTSSSATAGRSSPTSPTSRTTRKPTQSGMPSMTGWISVAKSAEKRARRRSCANTAPSCRPFTRNLPRSSAVM